jgi:Rrf2 family protein
MKLTRASSYALHAAAYLAAKKGDKPTPSHTIAKTCGIKERFLLKVLKPLVSARVLTSIKGPNGGYRLARPASEIALLDIIEAGDQGAIHALAPFNDPNNPALNKKIDNVCTQTSNLVRGHLKEVKLADLVGKRSS